MRRKKYSKIIALLTEAARLAMELNIPNLFQPGIAKEMVLADLLGHELMPGKRDADAHDVEDPTLLYEYLTYVEGGSAQIDRMFKQPPGKRDASLKRILRNHRLYFAVFFKQDPLVVKTIFELSPRDVADEAGRQLDQSTNAISHVGFSQKWVREHARVVYQHAPSKQV